VKKRRIKFRPSEKTLVLITKQRKVQRAAQQRRMLVPLQQPCHCLLIVMKRLGLLRLAPMMMRRRRRRESLKSRRKSGKKMRVASHTESRSGSRCRTPRQ
jgi:hypothetical protein